MSHHPCASPRENGSYHSNLKVSGLVKASCKGLCQRSRDCNKRVFPYTSSPCELQEDLRVGGLCSQHHGSLVSLSCASHKPKRLNRISEKSKLKRSEDHNCPPSPLLVTCLWILSPKLSKCTPLPFPRREWEDNGKGNNSCQVATKDYQKKKTWQSLTAIYIPTKAEHDEDR